MHHNECLTNHKHKRETEICDDRISPESVIPFISSVWFVGVFQIESWMKNITQIDGIHKKKIILVLFNELIK